MTQPTFTAASPLPPIVCLGASAGGLRALETFFHQMPTHSGCSFVVVQHLSPDFRSLMDDLLGRQTTMKIHRVEDGMLIEPNSVYLIPAKKVMTVQGGRLTLTERGADRAAVRNSDLPINVFLCSLAADAGPRAVAVILSGTGSDGTEGVLAVHQAGGLVIVQDPDTAEFDGMPRSAIATGIADYELAPEKMPEFVLAYAHDRTTRLVPPERNYMASGLDEDTIMVRSEFAAIFILLKRGFGIDFSHYKIATVERRIHRRMAMLDVKQLSDYATLLSTKPDELNSLYCDLLIGVTEFFRDPEAFAALRELVYAPLLRTAGREECRLWIAGCATGEEAYSHAMLLDEIANEVGYTGRICIFATDAHRNSLETASAGIYSRERLTNVSPERLNNYFRPDKNDTFRIRSDLRQRIVFAPHNLLNDPPFTKLDVVSCRNLLIYLSPQAQERCIGLFHYALRRDAVMMLGLSEGLGRLVNDFEVLDNKQKLYRKTRESRLPLDLRSANLTRLGRAPITTASPHTHISPSALPRGLLTAYDQLLKQYLPSGFILSEEANILHYIGDSGRFLPPVSGRAQESILSRTTGDLRLALSTLIPKVLRDRAPAESRGLSIELSDGSCEIIDLAVNPLTEDRSGAILLHVSLRNPRPPVPLPTIDAVSGDHTYTASEAFATQEAHTRRIVDLELELSSTKESLQATVEELQTTNEELQAANEEMLASNEELQSTNEELHSVNEELYTVNAEFESKNSDLKTLNADLDNLLKATDIGTLFLDRSLSIRMFNPSIEMIFHLMPQDIGRPIEHIAYHLAEQSSMIEEIRSVLTTGISIEGEVRTRDGHWLLKRILPFYAAHRAIEGVVLTFTSIDKIKAVQNKLDLAMLSARLVWWEWELPNGRFSTHSNGACILGYQVGDLPANANTWFNLTHPSDLERVRASLNACLEGKTSDWDCEHRYRDAKGQWRWVHDKGRITERDATGMPLRMIGTTQDIHARRSAESEVAKLSMAIDQMDVSVIITDANGRIEYVNPCFTQITGYTSAEVIGQTPRILKSDQTPPSIHEQIWKTILSGEPWRGELINRCKDGRLITERISISPVKDSLDNITHFIGVRDDITASKEEHAQRTRLEHQLAQSQKMETLGTLAGGIAHDFNNLLTSILGYTQMAIASTSPDHKIKPLLEQIDRAGIRGGDLVRRILAFSRHHTPSHQPVVLSRLYDDTLPLLRASLPSTIDLSLLDESHNCTVLGDSTHLQQVLFNLCTNAAHSIGTKVGQIVISLDRITLASSPETIVGKLTKGTYLRLIVADNGQGMSESVLARIFDPFFTTKPVGEGTGLGLSIIQNTLFAHKGAIAVQSTLGKGTTFTLYFPVAETPEALPIPVPASRAIPAAEAPGGKGERIMVIDDDSSIAELNVMALAEAGYQPSNMGTAAKCLAALNETPGAADLIITDQTMPGMTGLELAYALRAAGNRVPILITSGYNRLITPESMTALGLGFINKPFNIEDMLIETRRMLAPTQK